MNNISTDQWLDKELYPFQPHYVDLDAGSMHYVDEGKGDILLFVHGTPTWSFLYRDFIAHFSKTHRCIAIDHIGFGLSEKPKDFEGTPQAHTRNLIAFIEKLDLKNITLVLHDFGGPIGLGAGIQLQERIKQIVLFNSWLWATKHDQNAQKVDKVINSFLGRFLYLNLNFSPKVLLKKGIFNKKKLSKKVHQHYIKVFPNRSSRRSLLKIGQSLVGASDWYEDQWESLHLLEQKPWLILWGIKDEFISETHLNKWKNRLPKAKVKLFESGHFLQEEASEECIKAIEDFVRE